MADLGIPELQQIIFSLFESLGPRSTFILTLPVNSSTWSVDYLFEELPNVNKNVQPKPVTHLYDSSELSRMINVLKIMDLHTAEELNLPWANILDGASFNIQIDNGINTKKIHYYHPFEFIDSYPDIYRTVKFWKYLNSWFEREFFLN